MSFIEGYIIFAFSTAITACYLWFSPLVAEARSKNIKNSFTNSPKLSIVVYILVTAIISPLLVLPILVPSIGEAFERGLRKEILVDEIENS